MLRDPKIGGRDLGRGILGVGLLRERGRGHMSEHAGAEEGKFESRYEGHQSLVAVLQVATRRHHVTAKK